MIPIYECENREQTRTIHIEVTNACNLSCANCTRFVGHHRKSYFLTLGQVEEALVSLRDFPGNVGIMGGEPTIHPEFRDILLLMRKYIPEKSRRGLWTDGFRYDEYKNLIEETFLPENVIYNSHDSDVEDFHQPLLVTPEDIGVSPEEHAEYVDKCWIQRRWSASINNKGGFFCEVAAAKDVLFNGPGGYEVKPEWWNKTPAEFADQVERYCTDCSACIPLPKVSSLDERDYVSASVLRKLEEVKSPKLRRDKLRIVDSDWANQQVEINSKPWEHRKLEDCQIAGGVRVTRDAIIATSGDD